MRIVPMAKQKFEIPGVSSQTPAGEAATMILLVKAGPMFDAERAAASGVDMDAVHDMRVASRRLRESMNLFSPVMRKKPLARQAEVVRGVTRTLGRVRDADVFIDAFRRMAKATDDEVERLALTYLIARRQGERVAQLRRMRRRLVGLDLAASRPDFVEAAKATRATGAAMKPLVFLGREVLEARIAETYSYLPAALEPEAIEQQHAMRIACKHLRYAVETLAPCFDNSFSRVQRTLVSFQDILGDMHDIDIWAEYVVAVRETGEHKTARVSDRALGTVLRDLKRRRARLFERFKRQVATYPEDVMARRILGGLEEPVLAIQMVTEAETRVAKRAPAARRSPAKAPEPEAKPSASNTKPTALPASELAPPEAPEPSTSGGLGGVRVRGTAAAAPTPKGNGGNVPT